MFIPFPRLLAAAAVLLAYGAFCAYVHWRGRWLRHKRDDGLPLPGQAPVWVVHASQTGFAQLLAEETAQALRRAGTTVHLQSLGGLSLSHLQGLASTGSPLLLLASTCGEGNSPDEATAFVDRVMAAPPSVDLTHLRYGLLALGDRSYANFCGFGQQLDTWLQGARAQALFPMIEVDRGEEAAIARWQHQTLALVGSQGLGEEELLPPEAETFRPWRLLKREVLNDGGDAPPVVKLELVPVEGALPHWEAGDLALILPPTASSPLVQPRAYSIASLPVEGSLQLLVRLRLDTEGRPGLISGWLTQAPPGSLVPLRLRSHSHFHLGDNARRPLILIGAGTGMAGLRPLLLSRALAGEHRNWLLFGERKGQQDFHYGDDIRCWQDEGLLTRLDLAFSRDQADKIYVQDRLAAAADELRRWLAAGAAIYLCGSAATLAPAIDQVLTETIGAEALEALLSSGRYRRDVY